MALTITERNAHASDVWGRHRIKLVRIQFDSSYPTGGESFTAALVGLSELDFAAFMNASTPSEGYVFVYNPVSQTIKVFVEEAVAAGGPLLELANATDISTVVIRALVIGT